MTETKTATRTATTRTGTKTAKVEDKEYLIETADGVFKIVIPSTWKVTYGRVQPTESNGRFTQTSGDAFCVRIYETEKQQRAIFTGVKSFRDLSIKLHIHNGFEDDEETPAWKEVKQGAEILANKTLRSLRGENEQAEQARR